MAGRSLLPPPSHPALSTLRTSPNPQGAFRTTNSTDSAPAQPGSSSPFLSFLLPPGGPPTSSGAAGQGALPPFPTSPNFSTLTNVLANLGPSPSGNASSSAGLAAGPPAAMNGQATTPGGTAKADGEGGSGTVPPTDGQVVSCVFVIEATLRGRQAWKAFGESYLRAVVAKVQATYPRASAIRLLPLLFTSLPPATPSHLSLLQPLPYSSPSELLAYLPTLFDAVEAADVGGDEPAFLDAIVRAVELLDRPPPSLPPLTNTTEPMRHKKHLILFAATDLTPADLPHFNPNPQSPTETWSGALPALSRSEEFDSVGWVELLRPFSPNAPGAIKDGQERKGMLDKKEVMVGMVLTNHCPRLTWLLRRSLGLPLSVPALPSDGIKLLAPSHLSLLRGLDNFATPSVIPSAQTAIPAKRPATNTVAGNGRGTPQTGSSPLTNLSNNALNGSGPPTKKARFADPPPTQPPPPPPQHQQPQPPPATLPSASSAPSENQNRSQLGSFPTLSSAAAAPSNAPNQGQNQNQRPPSPVEDSLSAALAALERTNAGPSFLTASAAQSSQLAQPSGMAAHARQPSNASSVNSNVLPNISGHKTGSEQNNAVPGLPPSIPPLVQTADATALLSKACPPDDIGGVRNLMRVGIGERVPTPQEVFGWMEATRAKGNGALKDIQSKLERGTMMRGEAEVQLRKLKAVIDERINKFQEMRILVGKLWREHLSRSNVPLHLLQPQQGPGQPQQQQQQQQQSQPPANVSQPRPPPPQQPQQAQQASVPTQMPGVPNGGRLMWKGMLQWKLPNQQAEGRTFAAAFMAATSPLLNEAATLMKQFPNVCTLQLRRDNIAAAREFASQNRMVTITIAAITAEMLPNAPAGLLDKAGHPAAPPGNAGGFLFLLQALTTAGAIAFVGPETGRGAVFVPDDNRRTLTCILFRGGPIPPRFGNAPPVPQQMTQQQQQSAAAAALQQNPALLQAFLLRQQQQATQQAQQKAVGAQQPQPQGIIPQAPGQGQGPMGFGGPAGGTAIGLGNPQQGVGAGFNPQLFMNSAPGGNEPSPFNFGNFGR